MGRTKSISATLADASAEVKTMQERLAELEMFARHVWNAATDAANKGEKASPSVLLGLCRFTSSRNNAARTAARMERFTAEQRDRWAIAVGAHPASDETWAMVIAAVRARYPRPHRHDFSDGDVCSTCDAVKRLEAV